MLSKYLTRDNSTFRECSPLRTRSSFKRFLHCGSKVLGVVKSPKCFVLKWGTSCRFSTCVVSSFLYLDTNFIDILFRVPQCYLFRRHIFFAYFKSVTKISKGFKKWNSCRKINLKTNLIVSKVITATSVTKIIFGKYKFVVFVLKRKMLISLSHRFLFGQINSKSHSFFLWVVMFNLTIFWVRENRNLVNIRRRNFLRAVYNQLYDCRVLFACTALVPFAHSNIS